ncbi:MAG: hypothetical protein HRU76_01320 [Phycisphaeraceae bacterium]|nr:MAG: hypothetical protein HRU76_01320 [Phycisphaeraceae bacterium]
MLAELVPRDVGELAASREELAEQRVGDLLQDFAGSNGFAIAEFPCLSFAKWLTLGT